MYEYFLSRSFELSINITINKSLNGYKLITINSYYNNIIIDILWQRLTAHASKKEEEVKEEEEEGV